MALAQKIGPITQTPVGTWAASSTIRTNLDRLGLVTEIRVTFEVTTSATLAAGTSSPGGLYRVANNLIVKAGNHSFFELPSTGESGNGGHIIHAMNDMDFHGMPAFPDQQTITGAQDRTYHPITFIYHCGSRPLTKYGAPNPFDLTAFIPATKVNDLVAEWFTAIAAGLDDTITLDSAVARYTIAYVTGTHEEIQQEMRWQEVNLPAGLVAKGATGMVPAWVANTFAIDATYTNFSLVRNLTPGAYLKRVFILSQDATGSGLALLANDEVTGARIKIRNNTIIEANMDALAAHMPRGNFLVADDAVSLGAGGHLKGLIPLDLRAHGHADYGWDLTQGPAGEVGAAQLGQTVTTRTGGDDALYLEERYEPYFESLST